MKREIRKNPFGGFTVQLWKEGHVIGMGSAKTLKEAKRLKL